MKRRSITLLLLTTAMLGSCGGGGGGGSTTSTSTSTTSGSAPTITGDEYDEFANKWSKPGHLYFHYNRGEGATDYDNYCLWLWQFFPQNLEGSLWGYDGPTEVSSKLTLHPMTTKFMQYSDVGLEGGGNYVDKYGVVFDVDLYASNLVGGKTGKSITYEGAESLGFLLPLQSSMDGSKNWTSDGGAETYLEDFSDATNWRVKEEEPTNPFIHVFVSTGALFEYSYWAGSGAPQPKVNPMEKDTTGEYYSKTEKIDTCSAPTPTSDSFKDLGVGYQIFVASFRDSNGDGIGDIRGIIDALPYLKSLGVQCLWLTPVQKSDSYHGYDISDYQDIDRRYGSMADYEELIKKVHENDMKIVMDLVLNHTSKTNVWFNKSKWGVNSGHPDAPTDDSGINWRNVYTWKYKNQKIKKAKIRFDSSLQKWVCDGYDEVTVEADANSDNPSWYRDGESNYYYYGKFGSGMPEINYENKATRKLIIDTAKFWLDKKLDGFRLDAVKHIYMKDEVDDTGSDAVITDVGEKEAYDDEKGEYIKKKYDYSSDLTKNVNWWREFSSSLKSEYPECFLVGENFDGWGTRTANYYQALDSQFDFSNYYHVPAWIYNTTGGASSFAGPSGQASETYDTFASSEYYDVGANIPVQGGCRSDFINGAFTSNHDVMRLINQASGVGSKDSTTANDNVLYGDDTANGKAKFQAAVTMLNPGLSWIYYGDELGMSSNTKQHIQKYGNENCMDIWYRQPMLWGDKESRPNYANGQYLFELDDHNKRLLNNGEGVYFDEETGKVETISDFYYWFKGLSTIKRNYPKGAKITYHEWSSQNVLRIDVSGEGGKSLIIFLNNGINTNDYIMNIDTSYKPLLSLGGAPNYIGGNIGGKAFSVAAFIKE